MVDETVIADESHWQLGAVRYGAGGDTMLLCAVCLAEIDPRGPVFHASAHKLGMGPGDAWMVAVAFSCGHHTADERNDGFAERLLIYSDGIVGKDAS